MQKSLINLLEYIDYDKYKVDLFIVHNGGIFRDYINKNVNVIELGEEQYYFENTIQSLKDLAARHHFIWMLRRIVNAFIWLLDKGYGAVFMSRFFPVIEKHYDVCIDYGGQQDCYFMVDGINADKKLTWFHNDYKKWMQYYKADKKYYGKVDAIITVSDECVHSIKDVFPQYSNKVYCIENIITRHTIEMFDSDNTNPYIESNGKVILATIARACHDKGTDIAISTARVLRDKYGLNFEWYWVGPGEDNTDYISSIENSNLDPCFIMTGKKQNPYPYMKFADIIVQPSRFEGKAISVEEAKVLNKPIVVANYSTVKDQIEDGNTGLVANIDSDDIAKKIMELVKDKALYSHIRDYQGRHCKGNADEVNKLLKLPTSKVGMNIENSIV